MDVDVTNGDRDPPMGTADAEIEDPSVENPELKGSPIKTLCLSEHRLHLLGNFSLN